MAVSSASVDRYLLDEAAAAELLASRVRLGAVAALFALQVGLFLSGVEDGRSGPITFAGIVVYFLVGVGFWLWLRRGYTPLISYWSVLFDVLAASAYVVAYGLSVGQLSQGTKFPGALLFFVIAALAGLRQQPRLALFAGALSGLAYIGLLPLVAWLEPGHVAGSLSQDFSGPGVHPVRIASVAVLIFISGGVAAVTASRARDLVRRAVNASVRRQSLLEAMERYFPEKEALQMIDAGQELKRGGERRHVTVLTADIRGFTTISERLAPDAVVELLNRYFEAMVDVVFRHEGTLVSFVGDALWAVFGLPRERPDDAARAFAAAQEMRRRLAELNREGAFAGLGGLRIGIALHSGDVLAGNIGSARRLEYTVIGDTVNTTARLEELNKKLGSELAVSEATVALLGGSEGLEDRGELAIRGREQGLRVYAVGASPARVESA